MYSFLISPFRDNNDETGDKNLKGGMNMKFTKKIFWAFAKVALTLNVLRRWTGAMTDPRYDEISKQEFNCMFAYLLSLEVEHRGEVVNFVRLIKCAIYRAYQKAFLFYDTPEHIYREICKCGNIPYEKVMRETTHKIIAREAGEDFACWVEECVGSFEQSIYAAATKLVTFFEVKENQLEFNGDYADTLLATHKALEGFDWISGFKEMYTSKDYLAVFKETSKLRNQNRWASYAYRIEAAVSGHHYDTAVFSFFNAYNMYGEEEAVRQFFIGIFHDIPEAYTRDIPSPVKDMICGFRKASEEYERQQMEKHFYPLLPEHITPKVRAVALEELPEEIKKLGKVGDYLSAASEIHRQIPDKRFSAAMYGHTQRFEDPNGLKLQISEEAYEFFKELEAEVYQVFKEP